MEAEGGRGQREVKELIRTPGRGPNRRDRATKGAGEAHHKQYGTRDMWTIAANTQGIRARNSNRLRGARVKHKREEQQRRNRAKGGRQRAQREAPQTKKRERREDDREKLEGVRRLHRRLKWGQTRQDASGGQPRSKGRSSSHATKAARTGMENAWESGTESGTPGGDVSGIRDPRETTARQATEPAAKNKETGHQRQHKPGDWGRRRRRRAKRAWALATSVCCRC